MATLTKVEITSKATTLSPSFSMYVTRIAIDKKDPRYVVAGTGVKRVARGKSRLTLEGVLKADATPVQDPAAFLNRPKDKSARYDITITQANDDEVTVTGCECVGAVLVRTGTSANERGVAVYGGSVTFEFQPYDWSDSDWMWDSIGAKATTRTISSAANHSTKGSILIDMDYTVWQWRVVRYKYELSGTDVVLQGPDRVTKYLPLAKYIEIGEDGKPTSKSAGRSASDWSLRRDALDQGLADMAVKRTQTWGFKNEPLPHVNAMVIAESDMGED